MRKIKKRKRIKLSQLALCEFTLEDKQVSFYYEIRIDTINKLVNFDIVIDLDNYKESFLRIVWEQIYKKEDINYEELIKLDSRILFNILKEFVFNDEILKYNFEKRNDIGNPFIRFLTVLKENLNEILEERIERKEKLDISMQKLSETIKRYLKTIDEIAIKKLRTIYQLMGISEDKMDFSQEKKKLVLDIIYKDLFRDKYFKNMLIKYNWYINIDFDKSEQQRLLTIKNNEDEINEYILSISTKELMCEMLNMWKKASILDRRIHIIEKCFKAYDREDYWLFIPTMLTQLEGMVMDIFDVKGKYVIKDLKNKIDELVDLSGNEFDSNASNFYKNVILSGFEIGKECNPLSRHSILHGYNTEYGNKINALKIIYFFDYVLRALYYASDVVD